MPDNQMLGVLRHAEIAPKNWTATGPDGALKVVAHSRSIDATMHSGTITFQVDDDGNTFTLVGTIAADGTESVTKDGVELPDGAVDGGVGTKTTIRGFPPRVRIDGIVIVKFLSNPDGTENDQEYRFEGKFGTTRVDIPINS